MEFTQKVKLTRLDIFLSSLKISLIEPIFGLGGASFPIIYELQNNVWRGHPHNLLLELVNMVTLVLSLSFLHYRYY